MKQNQGTFWTFVITTESTAVDLMDLVSAKCGIPVEVMALYSSTEKNVGMLSEHLVLLLYAQEMVS